MGFNVVCSLIVVFFGGAVEIYTFSNVGYLGSFIPVLIGYYLLRRFRADMKRPVRLPGFFKYIALAMAALYFVIWSYGGLRAHCQRIGNDTAIYYFIGWLVALSYVFFYWYRVTSRIPSTARPASRRRRRRRQGTDRSVDPLGWGRCCERRRPHLMNRRSRCAG